MARIKYYDSTSSEWKYGDSVGSSAQYVIYDPDGSYSNGTVEKELKTQSSQIAQKADKTELIPLNATMASTHSLSGSEESYLLNSVIKKSNRNLFDNPWMEINQRGVTSVNGQAYFCDRWRANTTSTKATLYDDYLKIELVSGKTNVENIDQQIEDLEFFAGKEVTVSCYYRGAELQIATPS